MVATNFLEDHRFVAPHICLGLRAARWVPTTRDVVFRERDLVGVRRAGKAGVPSDRCVSTRVEPRCAATQRGGPD